MVFIFIWMTNLVIVLTLIFYHSPGEAGFIPEALKPNHQLVVTVTFE
jgi:hypothetical protein